MKVGMRGSRWLLCLVLSVGCEGAEESGNEGRSGTPTPAATTGLPRPERVSPVAVRDDTDWTLSTTGVGSALILSSAVNGELLRLSCARDPAEMAVEAHSFQEIGSEERLSFGVDDEPYVFVAQLGSGRTSGVRAIAPIDTTLLRRLESATAVRAVYGSQTEGPHAPPDSVTIASFVMACRAALGAD